MQATSKKNIGITCKMKEHNGKRENTKGKMQRRRKKNKEKNTKEKYTQVAVAEDGKYP